MAYGDLSDLSPLTHPPISLRFDHLAPATLKQT